MSLENKNGPVAPENVLPFDRSEAPFDSDDHRLTPRQRREREKRRKMLDEYRRRAIDPRDNVLDTRPANDWLAGARHKRVPRLLCGSLWREGELAIMFADTGVGKSIFAVQLGEAIARGRSIGL